MFKRIKIETCEFSSLIVDNIKQEEPVEFNLILPADIRQIDSIRVPIKVELKTKQQDKNAQKRKRVKKRRKKPKPMPKKFQCDFCPLKVSVKAALKCHMVVHMKETPFSCDDCGSKFKSQNAKYNHSKKQRSCFLCQALFKCNMALRIHVDQEHKNSNIMPFSCSTCELKFKLKNSLNAHEVRKQHGRYYCQIKNTFPCDQCSFEGKTKAVLTYHKQSHTGGYRCDKCGKKFLIQYNAKCHILICKYAGNEASAIQNKYSCKECGKSYSNDKNLKQHHLNVHRKVYYYCDHCPKICTSKGNLRYHCWNHFRITCPVCNQKYHANAFKRHFEDLHSTKHEDLQCDLCNKCFKTKIHLKGHLKRMHPGGQYTCLLCREKYEKVNELVEHQRVHVGRRHWKCLHCIFSTESNYELKRHLASRHQC